MNNLKKHFLFYWQRYACALIILSIIGVIVIVKMTYHNESKGDNYNFIKEIILDTYELDPSILQFDKDNKAILKMDFLYSPIDDTDNTLIDPIYNDDLDQCAGYIIVSKNKSNELNIDLSHMCDMIDF
jgi:hypothetical protein